MPGMDSIILSGMLSYKHLLILRFEHLSVCVNWVLQLATMLQCSHLQRDPLKNWLRLVDVFSLTQVSLDLLQGNQIKRQRPGFTKMGCGGSLLLVVGCKREGEVV